ncbi:MAG TPA: hypothetical protein VLD62_12600 [Acidimicrobiia bacterium]|nr:hypothetical protein [Acidimicrobiia bacterium]
MTDSSDRVRTLVHLVAVLALLLVPTLAGFAVAGSQSPTATRPGGSPAAGGASTSGTTTVRSSSQDVVSDRPVGVVPSSAEEALSREVDDDSAFPRLEYAIEGSGAIRIGNGGVISLGNGLELVVELDPYPADRFDVDVRYRLQRADGAPIDNATIDVDWDMRFMFHGPFETRMTPVGGGAYEASYEFFMFGPWYLDTTVAVPGAPPIDLSIDIYVWPSG